MKLDLARTDFLIAFYLCYRYFMNRFYFEKENIEINGVRHSMLKCALLLKELSLLYKIEGSSALFLDNAKS